MGRPALKILRVAGAALVFAGLTAALVDFRGAVPGAVGHALASIQFVPSVVTLVAGAAVATAALVVLVVTLAVGRIYCSVVCPLGILQDIVARGWGLVRRGKGPRPHRPAATFVRQFFLWGTVAGMLAGWAGLTLSLLDPYSIFGRIAADLFRPVVTMANNALVGVLGGEFLYRVAPGWSGAGVLAVPVAMLVLVAGLAAWRGRLYCNTVCPVGTVLGFVAVRSAWRLSLDREACRKCGDCLRVCKAQCIDLRRGTIDHSRCVACYNCLGACHDDGIRYRWSWGRGRPAARPPLPAETARPAGGVDRQRRAFVTASAGALTAAAGMTGWTALRALGDLGPGSAGARAPDASPNASPVICPPGSGGVDRFLDDCTACHLCISACPTHVLRPAFLEYGWAGLLKPRLDYRGSFCNFDCRRCAEVCPDGAISLLALAEKQVTRIGAAQLNLENCIVKTKGTDCAACSEHCPTKAVDTVPYGDNLRLPQVDPNLCIGCGACEYACPAQPHKAITVAGRRTHERATRRVEKPAADPRRAGDFPF